MIHIGGSDFVLQKDADDPHVWKLTRIEVGDAERRQIEVLSGLEPGAEVITQNTILLKPVVAGMLRDSRSGAR